MLLSWQHRSPGAGRFLPSTILSLSSPEHELGPMQSCRSTKSLGPAAAEGCRRQRTERDEALIGETPTGANRSPLRLTKDELSLGFYPAG